MDIKLDNLQLVLYSPGIVIADKLKTANMLKEVLPDVLDGEPLILPLPNDAPPEIPRMLLKSKDEKYKLQVAVQRMDFIFHYKKEDEKTLFPVPGFFEKVSKLLKYFRESVHTQFARIGVVTNWTIELEKSSATEYLFSKYIQEGTPLRNSYKLELHCLTKETIADLKANKWTRIKSALKVDEPEQDRFITLHVDINTLADEKYEFDQKLLQEFLNETSMVIKRTIDTHLKRLEE